MKQRRDCYDDQDDAALVASILAGEREAFDILLQRYSSSVLRLCTTVLGNTLEAQDIAQEASLQAFLGLSRLQEPARFAAWFHAIAANLARSALRRRRERSLHTLSDDAAIQNSWIDPPQTPEEYQTVREIHETILLALRDLSEVNRQAVIGFYLQGYSYEELAQILGVPVSTVKGRLFQGRQQLKTLLRPLADTLLQTVSRQRKEQKMTAGDLIELKMDSLRTLLLTRQHLVILRDPQTGRGFPIRLTASEADALDAAFFYARRDANELPFPQDLSQRLLESFGAQLQRVVINALAGQTLYATLTMTQGSQTREVDMPLSESLALAVRMGVPISITRSLFETMATLDLITQGNASSWEELLVRGKNAQNLGWEERMQLEEEVRHVVAHRRSRQEEFFARLWAFMLESLTGARDNIPAAELRALDIATTFPTREITWDERPMVAIRLPDQRETAWILVRPSIWGTIEKALQHFRELEYDEEQTPPVAKPVPDVLPPQMQQRIEESLARLVESPEMRTALLLNPQGILSAWKGQDTEDTLQRFSSKLFRDISQHAPLANQGELRRQFGRQPQKATTAYGDKKAVMQELPEKIGGVMVAAVHPSGWRLVTIFAEKSAPDLKEETHQLIRQTKLELSDILAQ